jgi:hypothetical protein
MVGQQVQLYPKTVPRGALVVKMSSRKERARNSSHPRASMKMLSVNFGLPDRGILEIPSKRGTTADRLATRLAIDDNGQELQVSVSIAETAW